MASVTPAVEGTSLAAAPVSGPDSSGEWREVQGGDGEKDSATKGTEAVGESEEDGEDVFEVEKILDMKTEAGKILYKVRWKGYASDDDTWEPEIHLEDCKEVLLEFKKELSDNKAKALKKDLQKLSLNSDIFEANSDSDQQSETKEDSSPRKKKKKLRNKEDKSPDDPKKRKTKTGKLRVKSELGSSSESLVLDLRTKKRTLEAKKELKDSKKTRKDEIKETKELRKGKKADVKDVKNKEKEDPKDNRKTTKEKWVDGQLESESGILTDYPLQEDDKEEFHSDSREEKQKLKGAKDTVEQDTKQDDIFEKQLNDIVNADEDDNGKGKRKKKKPRKTEEVKEVIMVENKKTFSEKKIIPKKQRNQGIKPSNIELDKLMPYLSAQTQKSARSAGEDRGFRSSDSTEEAEKSLLGGEQTVSLDKMEEKETLKTDLKEQCQKKPNLDKEEKGQKEPKGLRTLAIKEIKNAFDLLKKTTEEKNDVPEANRKKEEMPLDCKTTEDCKMKEGKCSPKEKKTTRDDTDTWAHIAAEGDQEAPDSVCQMDESSDGRQQILSLGMDLQLEWMSLEDFQKHLNGEDETFATVNVIPNNLLRDAVKNGDYITVKVALNSDEDYNLEQEDASGMTLVMLAAAGGQDDLLRLLITKGAKVNGQQKNGTTALIHAAEKNFLTTVAILLEAGAFVNVQQSNGETALMKACKRGNSDIVRLVIEWGADCNILSKHQNNALYFAKQCNNMLVYELLKSHLETLSRVAEETIRDYFEARLALLEPVFPIACHRLCEGPNFSTDFNYNPPQNIPEGKPMLSQICLKCTL
ncbi:M-phase phosphoprotein 8 isoform 1-T1 [Thomomys bottae]